MFYEGDTNSDIERDQKLSETKKTTWNENSYSSINYRNDNSFEKNKVRFPTTKSHQTLSE